MEQLQLLPPPLNFRLLENFSFKITKFGAKNHLIVRELRGKIEILSTLSEICICSSENCNFLPSPVMLHCVWCSYLPRLYGRFYRRTITGVRVRRLSQSDVEQSQSTLVCLQYDTV